MEYFYSMGNNLKKIRREKKLTQTQLAELVGFEQGTVQRHEAGTRDINTETLQKYATALGCTPSQIIGDTRPSELTPEEQEWLDILHDIPEDKRKLYMSMAEPLREDYGHGQPRNNKKQNENGTHK